jgi:predicted Zn finger-like uncharacterized protein
MLIVCKTCASSYHIPREIFGESGCRLRCVGCGETWMVTPEAVAADSADVGEDAALDGWQDARHDFRHPPSSPAASNEPARAAPRSRRDLLAFVAGKARQAAVVLGVLAVVGGAMGAVAARAKLVAFIPGAAHVFAAIGLPVNLRGLALADLRTNVASSDDRKTLVVEGAIVNLRDGPTEAPNMRIALRGADKRELYVWTAPAPKAMLSPNERVAFRTRLAAPPEGVSDVLVRFAAGAEKVTAMKEGL